MEVRVIKEVSEMLKDKKVVTEEEIRRFAVRGALRVFGESLVDVGDDVIDEVVESLTDVPLTLNSLHYSEKVSIDGIDFYHIHTHCPSKEEFEEAYARFVEIRAFMRDLESMKRVTDSFFEGYLSKGSFMKEYRKDKFTYFVFYTTVREIEDDLEVHKELASRLSEKGEYVAVVPTEKELNEFLRFFRRYSEDVKKAGLKIWVVNAEKETMDPFIGYPKDFRLISRFKNPKVATLVNSLWRPVVDEID